MGVQIPCMCMWWDSFKSVYQCFSVIIQVYCTISATPFQSVVLMSFCKQLLKSWLKFLMWTVLMWSANFFQNLPRYFVESFMMYSQFFVRTSCIEPGFCPVREQWVKMLAHNYNLSDHWSKDLLFDLFVSHVFCFFLRPFFVKNLVIILHIFSCGLLQIEDQILLCQKLVNLCKYNNIVSYFALSWPYNYDQMAL